MSRLLINQYYNNLDRAIQFGKPIKKQYDKRTEKKFNTNRFADYKDHVIDLLKRICTVSVEIMKIVREMEKTN